MEKISKDIKEEDRPNIIRKGNELFNKGDIILAYQCYKLASYPSGIEKIGDFYYFTKHDPARAIIFYKQAAKEDPSGEGTERVQQKIKDSAVQIVEVIRKWMEEDKAENREDIKNKAYIAMIEASARQKFHTKDEKDNK